MSEAAFAHALLHPDAPLPAGIVDPDGRPAPKRFAVYRNNVTVSLIKALETGFPVVQKLVGEAFFAAMARQFVLNHPPRSRIMMLYGEEFAEFLSSFAPVSELAYLPDVARLEQAIRESYHSADGLAMPPDALMSTSEAELLSARLKLVPSLRLIRSDWPVYSIWSANMNGGPPPVMRPEDVVVLRPDFDPRPALLPLGGGAFIAGCLAGNRFAECLSGADETLDMAALLGLLISGQAIEGLER